MTPHQLAGKPPSPDMLTNIPRLVSSYYTDSPKGQVSFGTSGHRGSSLDGTFNEAHIAATAQAICEFRKLKHIKGPLFIGFDTHALSAPAFRTALGVFAGNDVESVVHAGNEYTPTPVISYLILNHNRKNTGGTADGVIITPSHNPPKDGGFKYNPPHGGPADIDVTGWIQERANRLMQSGNIDVKRKTFQKAIKDPNTSMQDFITPFVESLPRVINMEAIRSEGIKIGVDPMGGAGIHFWGPIAERYGLDMEIFHIDADPAFGFMKVDFDGQIRMDCSSPYAMAGLIEMADRFDIAWGNDTDADRHGIVCPSGLMNPNHYLSVAIWYLLNNRPGWKKDTVIGKTLVSSSMIDRVVAGLKRRLYEVPVGFKWFVPGLLEGSLAFGGEESAGAAFLCRDGKTWTTDKDGFSLTLLAAEILAVTGRTPAEIYMETLTPVHGEPYYKRADKPVTEQQRAILQALAPDSIEGLTIAGLPVSAVMTSAPGNNAAINGVKILLGDGSWFAVRPSGTEPKMKVYVESFGGEELWERIHKESLDLIFGNQA